MLLSQCRRSSSSSTSVTLDKIHLLTEQQNMFFLFLIGLYFNLSTAVCCFLWDVIILLLLLLLLRALIFLFYILLFLSFGQRSCGVFALSQVSFQNKMCSGDTKISPARWKIQNWSWAVRLWLICKFLFFWRGSWIAIRVISVSSSLSFFSFLFCIFSFYLI